MRVVHPRLAQTLHCRLGQRLSLSSSNMVARRGCSTQVSSPPLPVSSAVASSAPVHSGAALQAHAVGVSASHDSQLCPETPRSKPDSVATAVASLREAINAWSVVEKQKLQRACSQGGSSSRRAAAAMSITSTPTTTRIAQAPEASEMASTLVAHSDSHTGHHTAPSSTTSNTTSATNGSVGDKDSDFGVRNKQDRFWAYVYTPSEPAAHAAEATIMEEAVSSACGTAPTMTKTTKTGGSTPATAPTPAPKTTFSSVRQSTTLGRSRPSIQPFRSQTKRQVAIGVAELVNLDPGVGLELAKLLSAESRRLMVVMGTASEYFGGAYGDVVEQVKMADRDRDRLISSEEYDIWASRSFQRRPEESTQAEGREEASGQSSSARHSSRVETLDTTSSEHLTSSAASVSTTAAAAPAVTSAMSPGKHHDSVVRAIQRHPDTHARHGAASDSSPSSPGAATTSSSSGSTHVLPRRAPMDDMQAPSLTPTALFSNLSSPASLITKDRRAPEHESDPRHIKWSTWWKLVLVAAPPFFAFGLLDNTTFVLSGDAIDRTMSEAFHLSEMAAAALGGVVSGVAGIQVHGLAEKYTRMTPPVLSAAQKRSSSYHRADHVGNSLGMVVGLIAGMLPLLWLHKYSEDEQNEDIAHDIALMKQEAVKSAKHRVQREDKLRHLLDMHEHQEWEELMKQAKAERMKMQLSRPTRTPDNIDDRHNPH